MIFFIQINCRMAGKAAFEEIVGRCCDSHGKNVVILSSEDFYLGPRNSAFLRAAPFVAKTKMYTEPLIDHLVEKKLNHWDINIREISSKSLHLLTKLVFILLQLYSHLLHFYLFKKKIILGSRIYR